MSYSMMWKRYMNDGDFGYFNTLSPWSFLVSGVTLKCVHDNKPYLATYVEVGNIENATLDTAMDEDPNQTADPDQAADPAQMDTDHTDPQNTTDQDADLNASFDLSHRNLDAEPYVTQEDESFIGDLDNTIIEDVPITFKVLENGSKRGGRLLVSSDGFSYCVKNNNKSSTLWRCSVKSKKLMCYATVKQVGDNFARGPNNHLHPADPKLPLQKEILMKSKEAAAANVFRPAMDIIEDAITDHVSENNRFLAPKKLPMKRLVNKYRASFRPKDPNDLQFMLDQTFLRSEEFLVSDITADNQRHLIFATDFQLDLLRRSKEWFIDGTFKVVPAPFYQLMTIHAFITQDGCRKQFPLVFVLMSRRQKSDYREVFSAIIDRLGNPAVEQCVLDFEKAAWTAIAETLPNVTLRGCVFQWSQALWRRIQDSGLAATYRQRDGVHRYVRQLLALPFLPGNQIQDAFQHLKERANTDPLQDLVGYIDRQWISSTVFPPSSWTVFRQSVRTNNDVEGWHHCLNAKAGHGRLGFYRLVPLLRREAEIVHTSISSGDLDRNVGTAAKDLNAKIEKLWDQYIGNEISTGHFLRSCSSFYGPAQ